MRGLETAAKFDGTEIAPDCAIILGAVFEKLREMVPGKPVSISFAKSSKNQKIVQRRGSHYV
jgi:hypothetical protein